MVFIRQVALFHFAQLMKLKSTDLFKTKCFLNMSAIEGSGHLLKPTYINISNELVAFRALSMSLYYYFFVSFDSLS